MSVSGCSHRYFTFEYYDYCNGQKIHYIDTVYIPDSLHGKQIGKFIESY